MTMMARKLMGIVEETGDRGKNREGMNKNRTEVDIVTAFGIHPLRMTVLY